MHNEITDLHIMVKTYIIFFSCRENEKWIMMMR
jgi:hypothetical protein